MISDLGQNENDTGCYKMFTIENGMGAIVHFIVSPTTYFLDHVTLAIGDRVTGYYDGNAPTIMIYPPQYQALLMVKEHPQQQVKVDYFDSHLLSSDGQLQLNLNPDTSIFLTNNQIFSQNPANHHLIAVYGPATKSIPALTTPYKVIVWC